MKSEMKLPRDREVKFVKNSREMLENQEIEKFQNFGRNDFHLANSYFHQKCKFFHDKMRSCMQNFTLFSREKG